MRISRQTGSLLALAPVIACVLLAIHNAIPETTVENPCWFLVAPRAAVALPTGEQCPLQFLDTVVGVEGTNGSRVGVQEGLRNPTDLGTRLTLQVVRSGVAHEVDIEAAAIGRFERGRRALGSTLIGFALMWIPILLLSRSKAAAAPALAIFYSAVVVVGVTTIALRTSQWMTIASAVAVMIAPAALVHLSFFFPQERPIVRGAPGVVRIPYLVVPVLMWVAAFSLTDPLVLLSFVHLLLALYGLAWLILMASSSATLRGSETLLARARAHILFWGALTLPLLPSVAVALQYDLRAGVWVYFAAAPLVLPLPVGFAISRYNLFDLEFDLRFLMVRALYFGFGAFVMSTTAYFVLGAVTPDHELRDISLLFAIALGCVAIIEVARRPLLGLLDSTLSPRLDELTRVRDKYHEQTTDLSDRDEIARLTADALQRGLQATSGCVFLLESRVWRAVAPFGDHPTTSLEMAADAAKLLGTRSVIQIPAIEFEESVEFQRLQEADVHLALPITSHGELLGVALVAGRGVGETYAGREVEFAVHVAQAAAQAIHNALIADERAEDRHETLHGLWSILFVHRIGKNLMWTQNLIRKSILRATGELQDDDGEAAAGRLNALQEQLELLIQLEGLTEPMSHDVQAFLNDAMERRKIPRGYARIEEILEFVVRRIGDARVRKSTDPELGRLVCHEFLGDAVLNLVQNALQETERDGEVHIRAQRCDGNQVSIAIADDGRGIPDDLFETVFDAGYTTHAEAGGSGVGLGTSRDLIQQLGGKIKLEPRTGGGTIATITIPPVDIENSASGRTTRS